MTAPKTKAPARMTQDEAAVDGMRKMVGRAARGLRCAMQTRAYHRGSVVVSRESWAKVERALSEFEEMSDPPRNPG